MYNSHLLDALFETDSKRPTYIISEIGINHNGSLETALKLIEASKEAGVNAVKFQKRDIQEIYSKNILEDSNNSEWSFEYLIPILHECELSQEDYRQIRAKCDELELDLIITPMDETSVHFVAELGISAFKIASADMTNLPLIACCATYKKPLLISTGMWEEKDILTCINQFEQMDAKVAMLLSQSTYPAPFETLNLGFIETLKKYARVVGYSGHERDTFIPVAAVAMGCKIIEKHITLDKTQSGPDHKASMLPEEWKQMVYQIRMLEKATGCEKKVNQAEILNKELFAKSAIAKKTLKKGHVLTKQDITFKAPGKGIFPHEINQYYGKILNNTIEEEHFINHTDFEEVTKIVDWQKFHFKKDWGVKCRFHDFDKYAVLKSPCIEFHCSQTDLKVPFEQGNNDSQLIVHAPEIFDRELVDLCSKDTGKVERSLKILQDSINKTLEIAKHFPKKRPKMVVHLGGMSLDERTCDDTFELTMRAIEPFKRLTYDPEQLEIIPENLPPRPWYMGGEWFQHGFMRAEDMIVFCEELNLKMCYDICHAQLYCSLFELDQADYARVVMPYVSHLHISDALGINGEGLQIFDGEIAFDPLFQEMESYAFTWVPEIWSGHHHEGTGTYKCMRLLDEKYCTAL